MNMFLKARIFSQIIETPFRNHLLFSKFSSAGIKPCNEPILPYGKDGNERRLLKRAIADALSKCETIPIVIGDKEIRTDNIHFQVLPHQFSHKLAKYHYADKETILDGIKTATKVQEMWDRTPICERIKIWERAADLMSTTYRQDLNAATMLGQAKTVIQAEIDSAAELVDFMRFNAYYLQELLKYSPDSPDLCVVRNSRRFRGLEGFFAAITPFNFTAIGGNLAYTPALMGNSVLWKPSDNAILSNWIIFKIMLEAGVPPGVVNFIPCEPSLFASTITDSTDLAGINYTGSASIFQQLWGQVGANISKYKNFPRLIGECGGKNYHLVHSSADIPTVISATIRSAFEYSGQKCSACSRMYVPESIWSAVRCELLTCHQQLTMGNVCNFKMFMSAVINRKAFVRISNYINYAEITPHLNILAGGQYSMETGYFIEPTIIQTSNPYDKIMCDEIFGPILAIYVYKDDDIQNVYKLINSTTKYALTGAIFGKDKEFLEESFDKLKMSAGNFYINDKCTGAVVDQQPFGGARMSGTNDKAGGPQFILRFTSQQIIKENFALLTDINYPYMKY